MRPITDSIIQDTIKKATVSPRGRAHYLLHLHSDPVQRMVNAIIPGSYVPPHCHKNPAKIELFAILVGQVACIHFTPGGKIQHVFLLDDQGPIRVVDIRPGIYHSFIALKPSAMLEIIQGPYQKETHKNWPSWAPQEDTPQAAKYLTNLELQVHDFLNHTSPSEALA